MIPVPGSPAVTAGSCRCGAVIQRAAGSAHDCGLCACCCPQAAARTGALKVKADKAVADLKASVSPSGGKSRIVNPAWQ